MTRTSISLSLLQGTTTVMCIFTMNIQTTISDYSAYFYDTDLIENQLVDIEVPNFYNYIKNDWTMNTNTWYKYLKLSDQKYDLTSSNHEIKGTRPIQSNQIILTDDTNYFYIKPIYDASGGVYTTESRDDTSLYNDIKITLASGTWTKESLISQINAQFTQDSRTNGSIVSFISDPNTGLQYTKIRLNINKIFTAQDFMLDFYDPVSFTTCTTGISGRPSAQNVSWDATLGWILGFRSTTLYYTTPENRTTVNNDSTFYTSYTNEYSYNTLNNIAKLTGDTCISVYLYNYFMIILDDYVQNHLNDGLVTITNTDYSIPLPSYANRATFRCDPITKKPVATSGITTYNNLTAKQLYAANEILNVQQTAQSKYSSGPFIQDIFGLIPIKVAGLPPGSPYIEFGGTLQLQERSYFGPVNIRRMTIKLVNDKGDIVNLNGANWSFSLMCEQLYTK